MKPTCEQLFDVAERERVAKIPAHGTQNQLRCRLPPLEDCRSGYVLHGLFRLPATPAKVATHPAKVLSVVFGTEELPLGFDRRLTLPEELNDFMSYYISGLYPELTAPSPSELYFYLLQSEVDAKDFSEGFHPRSVIRPFARAVGLVLVGVLLAHFLGC
jgi:hypothetical protein